MGKTIIPCSRSLFQAIECPLQYQHMIREVRILEAFGLFDKNFFIKVSIEKGTFHIHLVEFEVHSTRNWQKDANGLKSSYKSKGFIKVYSFYFSVTLSYQPRFIPYYLAILIRFVFEDPFGADDMSVFGPWNKFPYIIPHVLIQLFMHWIHLILILKGFFYPFRLKLSKVAMISYMVCNKCASLPKMKTFN